MDTATLRAWATTHGTNVEDGADRPLSLTSKLIRFRWNGSPTIAVGSDAEPKTRINAVLDGIAWHLGRYPEDKSLHIIVGTREQVGADDPQREQIDAIGTLITSLQQEGPDVRLWRMHDRGQPQEIPATVATFTSDTPREWVELLRSADDARPGRLAREIVEAIGHPSVALYPKLSSQHLDEPWQIRIDGFDIGRVGDKTGTLRGPKQFNAKGRPRDQWREIAVKASLEFTAESLPETVETVLRLIESFSTDRAAGSVLDHGQPEHGLEAHVLSGRLELASSFGPLKLAVPRSDQVLRAAQFPTLWGDVTRPPRYLDALLADDTGRPWAIELKDQDAGGGHGAYLRAGIGQAVLYRHYIRSVTELSPWFRRHGLDHLQCEAALAFPTVSGDAKDQVRRHKEIAARCGIHVIEFDRPGSMVTT